VVNRGGGEKDVFVFFCFGLAECKNKVESEKRLVPIEEIRKRKRMEEIKKKFKACMCFSFQFEKSQP
jgi:hypothetical protein